MPKNTKNKSAKKRLISVRDLQQTSKELTSKDLKKVKGGRVSDATAMDGASNTLMFGESLSADSKTPTK
jgi:hypothetical protein